MKRDLDWDGCFNVRDLGGFHTRDGRETRRGALVRADGLDRLTGSGWAALQAHGVCTVVDLRNDDEVREDAAPRPPGLTTVRVPLDDAEDQELWQHIWNHELDGSPLYFRLFLERKADRCVAAVRGIARAPAGGVVFHCGRGRDRTGLVALVVLSLAGVPPRAIASDYDLSTDNVRHLDAALGEPDQGSEIAAILERKNITARDAILDLLSSVDIEETLRRGGLDDEDLDALKSRFLRET